MSDTDNTMQNTVSRNVCVGAQLGIHARPAARISREAQMFDAEIMLRTEAGEADAKSMLDILSLAASCGTEICLTAEGADAEAALQKIGDLIADPVNAEG